MQAYSGRAFTGKAYTRKNKVATIAPAAANYWEEVALDTPLKYFRMNETSGTVANEYNGGVNGIYSGSFTYSSDSMLPVGGRSIEFAYGPPKGTLDLNFNANYTTICTLEFLFKADATQSASTPHIYSKNQFFAAAFPDFPISIRWDTANTRLQAVLSSGGDFTADLTLNSTTLSTATWHHVVFVYRGNGLCELYINGALDASASIGFSISSTSMNWLVGSATENSGGVNNTAFVGKIAEVAFYDKGLSASRIAAHFAQI